LLLPQATQKSQSHREHESKVAPGHIMPRHLHSHVRRINKKLQYKSVLEKVCLEYWLRRIRRFHVEGSLDNDKTVLGVFEKIGVDKDGGGNTQYLV
jgi:hypothetical protein